MANAFITFQTDDVVRQKRITHFLTSINKILSTISKINVPLTPWGIVWIRLQFVAMQLELLVGSESIQIIQINAIVSKLISEERKMVRQRARLKGDSRRIANQTAAIELRFLARRRARMTELHALVRGLVYDKENPIVKDLPEWTDWIIQLIHKQSEMEQGVREAVVASVLSTLSTEDKAVLNEFVSETKSAPATYDGRSQLWQDWSKWEKGFRLQSERFSSKVAYETARTKLDIGLDSRTGKITLQTLDTSMRSTAEAASSRLHRPQPSQGIRDTLHKAFSQASGLAASLIFPGIMCAFNYFAIYGPQLQRLWDGGTLNDRITEQAWLSNEAIMCQPSEIDHVNIMSWTLVASASIALLDPVLEEVVSRASHVLSSMINKCSTLRTQTTTTRSRRLMERFETEYNRRCYERRIHIAVLGAIEGMCIYVAYEHLQREWNVADPLDARLSTIRPYTGAMEFIETHFSIKWTLSACLLQGLAWFLQQSVSHATDWMKNSHPQARRIILMLAPTLLTVLLSTHKTDPLIEPHHVPLPDEDKRGGFVGKFGSILVQNRLGATPLPNPSILEIENERVRHQMVDYLPTVRNPLLPLTPSFERWALLPDVILSHFALRISDAITRGMVSGNTTIASSDLSIGQTIIKFMGDLNLNSEIAKQFPPMSAPYPTRQDASVASTTSVRLVGYFNSAFVHFIANFVRLTCKIFQRNSIAPPRTGQVYTTITDYVDQILTAEDDIINYMKSGNLIAAEQRRRDISVMRTDLRSSLSNLDSKTTQSQFEMVTTVLHQFIQEEGVGTSEINKVLAESLLSASSSLSMGFLYQRLFGPGPVAPATTTPVSESIQPPPATTVSTTVENPNQSLSSSSTLAPPLPTVTQPLSTVSSFVIPSPPSVVPSLPLPTQSSQSITFTLGPRTHDQPTLMSKPTPYSQTVPMKPAQTLFNFTPLTNTSTNESETKIFSSSRIDTVTPQVVSRKVMPPPILNVTFEDVRRRMEQNKRALSKTSIKDLSSHAKPGEVPNRTVSQRRVSLQISGKLTLPHSVLAWNRMPVRLNIWQVLSRNTFLDLDKHRDGGLAALIFLFQDWGWIDENGYDSLPGNWFRICSLLVFPALDGEMLYRQRAVAEQVHHATGGPSQNILSAFRQCCNKIPPDHKALRSLRKIASEITPEEQLAFDIVMKWDMDWRKSNASERRRESNRFSQLNANDVYGKLRNFSLRIFST